MWVRSYPLLNLEGVDVFAAADDDIFESAGDAAVALLVEGGFVARLEPGHPVRVCDQRFGCLLGVEPVALGELVSGDAELASLADGDYVALCIDDFGAGMGHDFADCGQSGVDAIGYKSIEAGGRCLGEAWQSK